MRHLRTSSSVGMFRFAAPLCLSAFVLLPSFAHAQIADSGLQEIAAIQALKDTFTPAEQKMSFNLVLLSREAQGTLPESMRHLIDRSDVDSDGQPIVLVDGYLGNSLLANDAMQGVEKVDGKVPMAALSAGKVRAHVLATNLTKLAGSPDVRQLREPEHGSTNAGGVTSQGVIGHSANRVIASGVTGAGVRVGVMSDSASAARVQNLIASGDLPSDTIVVPNQQGSSTGEDEGTAMMEIVHDMAPDAKLFFATAGPTQAQFAANIRSLRNDYHCDIIVDDYTYYAEGAFQDDTVAKAVNDVVANGALYFSSAANSGNLSSGTSGTWEGDFLAGIPTSAPVTAAKAGTLHNFGTAANPVYSDKITGASTYVTLKWSDPLGGATNDYDLYVLNAAGTAVIRSGSTVQTGAGNPFEYASGTFPVGSQVVVVLRSGAQRALRIDTNRGQLAIGTTGSTFGHNAGLNTFSMAATYWNSAHTGMRAFTGMANPVETFSSDGPRKIFYNPDGSAITPGNLLFGTNGGTTLQKPDATAADGVVTRTPGFNPFFGTSAAAPHAAGIAALVKSANPALSSAQIRQILLNTTVDNMAPGVDRDSGSGILQAVQAVQAAQATKAAQ